MGASRSDDWSARIGVASVKYSQINMGRPAADMPDILESGPKDAAQIIILAHGSGVGIHSPFMTAFADGLSRYGFRVVLFEFPYMSEARKTGRRRPPDREPVLLQTWKSVVSQLDAQNLIVGGKSLGGRIASLVADEVSAAGLICLGYPFHPPGKPATPKRTDHLAKLRTPTLICQGTRDPFGAVADVKSYQLSPNINLHWLEDGDHNFRPRKASGTTELANWQSAMTAIVKFADHLQ
jgi:predicted alpha/beta-hydrolase family hydrolase